SSTGQLIFIPLLMFFVTRTGWRSGSLTLVGAAIMLLPFIFLFMRDDPAEKETVPLREALRSSTFWLLAGSFFICGGTANGLVGTHLIPHSIDHGISA